MQANVGDRLVVESGKVDAPRREGEVLEVHGANGGPPFLVQWQSEPSIKVNVHRGIGRLTDRLTD